MKKIKNLIQIILANAIWTSLLVYGFMQATTLN